MSKLNWATARLILNPKEKLTLQSYHQERNGDELTKAIKVARKRQRRQIWESLQ